MDRNHPIVGFIENPLIWSDVEGWLRLLGGHLICSRGFPQVQKLRGGKGGRSTQSTSSTGRMMARPNTSA